MTWGERANKPEKIDSIAATNDNFPIASVSVNDGGVYQHTSRCAVASERPCPQDGSKKFISEGGPIDPEQFSLTGPAARQMHEVAKKISLD